MEKCNEEKKIISNAIMHSIATSSFSTNDFELEFLVNLFNFYNLLCKKKQFRANVMTGNPHCCDEKKA